MNSALMGNERRVKTNDRHFAYNPERDSSRHAGYSDALLEVRIFQEILPRHSEMARADG